jgi:hypothetical protein
VVKKYERNLILVSKSAAFLIVLLVLLESILPNFDFFVFPIFAFKLGHFEVQTIIILQTLKLNIEKRKKSLFYEEKVG